jgi:hypothetical protein
VSLQALGHDVEVPPGCRVFFADSLLKCFKPLVNRCKSPIDLVEAPVDLLKAPVDLVEAPVDLLKALIDLFEATVDLLDALIDLLETLADLLEARVDVGLQFPNRHFRFVVVRHPTIVMR